VDLDLSGEANHQLGESELSVVGAGDNHVSDAGPVPVGQGHLGCRRGVIEPMRAGTGVQRGDEVPGGGEHDRVESCRLVGRPGREGILSDFGEVADMDASVIEVEGECLGFAFAEGEGCCRFGGSVNRCSSVSWRAPWVCLMSRRTPPAPIAASC